MILIIENEAQFMAVWTALTQFIDNQDDSVEEHEWPDDVKAQVAAARDLQARFDAVMAKLAG